MTTNTTPAAPAAPAYKLGCPFGGFSAGLGRHAVDMKNDNYRGSKPTRVYGYRAAYKARCGQEVWVEDNMSRANFEYLPFDPKQAYACGNCLRLLAKDEAKRAAAVAAAESAAPAVELTVEPVAPAAPEQDAAPTVATVATVVDPEEIHVLVEVPGVVDRWLHDTDRLETDELPHDSPDYAWRHAVRTGSVRKFGWGYAVSASMPLKGLRGMIEELRTLAHIEALIDRGSRMIEPSVLRRFVGRLGEVMDLA